MNKENFKCKKCGIPIDGHNQYCHDGMCDDCFFGEYFPEEAQVFETDLEEIKKSCKINEKENMKFWNFLKSDELDNEIFQKIVKEIEEKIDCTKCGNCCKILNTPINQEDVKRISKHLNLLEKEFMEKYLKKDERGDFEFKHKPCIFLEEKKCKIYGVRPNKCKEYPYLDKDVTTRCHGFFSNAEICPIVFNVLGNAKEEFLEDIYAFENPDI